MRELTPGQQSDVNAMLHEMAETLEYDGWRLMFADYRSGRFDAPARLDGPRRQTR